MSHAMLLRLFLAPSFFSVHVALKYMMEYSDHIGITYYLTRRLREIDIGELREVWGFIWCVICGYMRSAVADCARSHLLVTRPSKSRALECFVVDTAQRSTHIAMIVRNALYHAGNASDISADTVVHASIPEGLPPQYPVVRHLPTYPP